MCCLSSLHARLNDLENLYIVHPLPLLDAPIPEWLVYDTDQALYFLSPSSSEADFDEDFGDRITKGYLQDFERNLIAFHGSINSSEKSEVDSLYCSILKLDYYVHSRRIDVISYLTRPCAEKLGFFRVVAWHLLQCCIHANKDILAVSPVAQMMSLLLSLSEKQTKFENLENKKLIRVDDLKAIKMSDVGVDSYFLEYDISSTPIKLQLNSVAFPTAAQLNSQEEVDKRRNKVFKRKHMEEMSAGGDGRWESSIPDTSGLPIPPL